MGWAVYNETQQLVAVFVNETDARAYVLCRKGLSGIKYTALDLNGIMKLIPSDAKQE